MTKLPASDLIAEDEVGEDECLSCGSDDTTVYEAEDADEETVRECFACGYTEVL